MAQFNVKDIDAATGIATKLTNMGEGITAIVNQMNKMAEDAQSLDQTAHLNEQLADYLKEASANLAGMVPGIEEAGKQLTGIVSSASQFAEAAAGNALGNV